MHYGVSAVRLDIGKEARIRTGQFFNIPGSLSQKEVVWSQPSTVLLALNFLSDRCGELATRETQISSWGGRLDCMLPTMCTVNNAHCPSRQKQQTIHHFDCRCLVCYYKDI